MKLEQNDPKLSQAVAERLINTRKLVISLKSFEMPSYDAPRKIINLTESGTMISFLVDVEFNRKPDSLKGKFQLRVFNSVRLVRLDFNGSSHLNPDHSRVGTSHLHIYREGYHDRWAYDPPKDSFRNLNDAANTLREFLAYCNVINIPPIR